MIALRTVAGGAWTPALRMHVQVKWREPPQALAGRNYRNAAFPVSRWASACRVPSWPFVG
jgi:hypothetical protein